MSAKSFEEWCESPEGIEAAIRQARAIHSGPHAYGEAAWTASRAALLADRPEVAGAIVLCRRALDRDETTLTADQALASQCLPALESLAAQLAEREAELVSYKSLTLSLAKAEEQACIDAHHYDQDRKQAEAELAKLKAHAGGLALEIELLLDFVRGYQGCKFSPAHAALAEYHAAYPKDAP